MRAKFAIAARKRAVPARLPLISQRAGPLTASPKGEATQRAKPLVSSGLAGSATFPDGEGFYASFPFTSAICFITLAFVGPP